MLKSFRFFIIIFILVVLFFPGFAKLQELKSKLADMENEIRKTQSQNALLEEKIAKMSNQAYLEIVAREKMGVVKKGVGDYKGARDVFEYAGKLRPKSSSPFFNLGDLYGYFLNDPQKAETNFLKALENDPYSYSIFLNLADFYRYKYPGKEDLYDKVLLSGLERIPEEVNIIAALAAYYRETGQVDKAITFYERLLKLNPLNETAKEDLAELKAKK